MPKWLSKQFPQADVFSPQRNPSIARRKIPAATEACADQCERCAVRGPGFCDEAPFRHRYDTSILTCSACSEKCSPRAGLLQCWLGAALSFARFGRCWQRNRNLFASPKHQNDLQRLFAMSAAGFSTDCEGVDRTVSCASLLPSWNCHVDVVP